MIIGKAITAGGSGGIKCKLNITTSPGAAVTATLGEKVVEAVADKNGIAILELSKEGIWTVTATYDGETVSKEVDTSLSVTANLIFVDPILANNSWEKISEVARAGKASQVWNIGDTKPMTVAGTTYDMQIMDFDMYDVADPESYGRTKAGIVFQYKQAVAADYKWEQAQANADDWITNYSEVKELIPTIKYPALSAYNSTSISTYQKKGINPSEQEIFGTTTKEKVAVGTQYAFYAAGNDNEKFIPISTVPVSWWTRSRDKASSSQYVFVLSSGKVSSSSSSYFCAPVFCL